MGESGEVLKQGKGKNRHMNVSELKDAVKAALPSPLRFVLRFLLRPTEGTHWLRFLRTGHRGETFAQRWAFMNQLYVISNHVKCAHTQDEMLSVIEAILSVPPETQGCIVEAGCFKGGSTAKFSLAAQMANRRLVVFDSFEGIPDNQEAHGRNIFGEDASQAFPKGSYCGALQEVKDNVTRFGTLQVCDFVKGWFEDTMVHFDRPIAAAYIDVDLASSTRTCLKYLYPLLVPGGVLFSQDGHLPLVIEVLNDERFWEKEVGYPRPQIEGLGRLKLVKIVKP